ncbi:hypothetical protein K402DRAFT_203687 [Aulographum hederae CBS 113979]|uniref:Uncharacterized protein n=1 Tax=Aulographum hederae CBS 113979 TaxID=1176131 RepID=A0A6G1HCP5_9PEZI|nr:hypothetical protein K402DRAFT_203687 [Aulographum hederae CBS 113979]
MADQKAIPFTLSPLQPIQLVELPPALLELINSASDNGSPPQLSLKTLPSDSTEHAHIAACPPGLSKDAKGEERFWKMEQVQISNSVYVVEPTTTEDGETRVTAISQVGCVFRLEEVEKTAHAEGGQAGVKSGKKGKWAEMFKKGRT